MIATTDSAQQASARHEEATEQAEAFRDYLDAIAKETEEHAERAFTLLAASGDVKGIERAIDDAMTDTQRVKGETFTDKLVTLLAGAFVEYGKHEKATGGHGLFVCPPQIGALFGVLQERFAASAADMAVNAAERGLQ